MVDERVQRRLAAILAADVVGYARLMEADEEGTLARLKTVHNDLIDPKIAEYGGRIFKTTGDGFLAEFPSAVDAVRHAVDVQRAMIYLNTDVPEGKRIAFRIGVCLGDVMVDGDDLFGNCVNVAARMEGLAEPGGICVSGNVQEHVGNSLEVPLEGLGEQTVKNIDRPVRCYRVHLESNGAPRVLEHEHVNALPLPDKPSIAVLPFDNMSGEVEQEYFADGLTEDIITELSRFQTFFVIARHSAFFYKGKAVTVQEVGRELGVHYMVEGSVRKAGNRLRVVVQLIETASGNHIWAERSDHDLTDIFDLQDEVTRSIVAAIPGRLASADFDRVRRKRPENFSAYDYMLRGRMHHHRATKEDNAEAIRLLEKAVELDPEFAEAYAWMSCTYGQALLRGFSDNKDELFARDVEAAEKALSLDANNFDTQWIMCELHMMGARLEQAERHHKKAFALNPNDPRIVAQRGELMTWLGHPDEGADWARQAMRLDPYDAAGRAHLLGRALFVARRYADAIEAYKQVGALRYGHHAEIAACHALLGSDEPAKLHAGEALRLKPDFSIADQVQGLPFTESRDREHYRSGLRKAGLPE